MKIHHIWHFNCEHSEMGHTIESGKKFIRHNLSTLEMRGFRIRTYKNRIRVILHRKANLMERMILQQIQKEF